ncbi:unnamed protein product, partial [Staurois parvus]
PHFWCQWEESAPSLVSLGGIVPHHWCQWRNSAPSLVSVGGIVPIFGVGGRGG